MPKLANKHPNVERILFTDFSGGLNLARPSEAIADNEMQVADNFEFSPYTGALQIRGGLMRVCSFGEPVRDIIPVEGGTHLVLAGHTLYLLDRDIPTPVGEIKGDGYCSYAYWGDEKQSVVMAFGGPLYIYDGVTLTEVVADEPEEPEETEEPEPEPVNEVPTNVISVFWSNGRIAVMEDGRDDIRYSGVGDPTNWRTGNDADAISVTIGYKDGCKMTAVAAMAGETLVFKAPDGQPEHGRIYRLQGEYPNWTIKLHSVGAAAWNPQSVTPVSNDLLFLTREGMASLTTATEFGDYKQSWAGAKINPKLFISLSQRCRVWHVASKAQVWVWDGENPEIWCYHYQIGDGAWTRLIFKGSVGAVSGDYVGIGEIVYQMNELIPDDDGEPITALWMPRTLLRHNQLLLKSVMASYVASTTAKAVARVDQFELSLPIGGQGDIASMDMDVAFSDTDPLIPTRSAVARRRTQIRRWDITAELEVTNGSFSLTGYGMEIVEV